MRIKILLCIMMLVASCTKESLSPREQEVFTGFEFPQGDDSWDQKFIEIYEKFGVQCIYKDVQEFQLNKTWSTAAVGETGIKGRNLEDEKLKNFYATFLYDNVFAFFDPEVTVGVLPQLIYCMDDLHERMDNPLSVNDPSKPKYYDALRPFYIKGLDFWGVCYFSDIHYGSTGKELAPISLKVELDYIKAKEPVLKTIMERMLKRNNITRPPFFSAGGAPDLDMVTEVKNKTGEVNDPNYFKRRGFPETLRSTGNYTTPSTVGNSNGKVNINFEQLFIDYLWLGVRYTKAQIDVNYAKFPLVIKYYDKVAEYMKSTYKIDLNAMATAPKLIE